MQVSCQLLKNHRSNLVTLWERRFDRMAKRGFLTKHGIVRNAIREDHQLITHGIYRFTRHPIYLGALLVSIGVPVYASSLLGKQ
jgi:hypothetical protein